MANDAQERAAALAACRAVLALPASWGQASGLDARRREALAVAIEQLEAGESIEGALAVVRDLFPEAS